MTRPVWKTGLIQIYTGNGKGKTTAALGLALRASGHGFTVRLIQFMKGNAYYGEVTALQRLAPLIRHSQYGRACSREPLNEEGERKCIGCGDCFIKKGCGTDADKELMRQALAEAERAMLSGEYDMVILDEVLNAINFELLPVEAVAAVLDRKPPRVELVLTGRNAPPELIARAHLVTEMRAVKHPYKEGIVARRGVEY